MTAGRMRDWPSMSLSLPTRSTSTRRLSDRPPTPDPLTQESKILTAISKSEENYDEDEHEEKRESERQGSPKTKKKKEKCFYIEKKKFLGPPSMEKWDWEIGLQTLRRCDSVISVENFGPRNERWEDAMAADKLKRRSSWQRIRSSFTRKKTQEDVKRVSISGSSMEGSKGGDTESRRTTIIEEASLAEEGDEAEIQRCLRAWDRHVQKEKLKQIQKG